MVNPWHKYQNATTRKKTALHSLLAGLAFFGIICFISQNSSLVLCPLRRIWGISCFGCGMSRGFLAILRLDFSAAFEAHVLSVPLFLGILIYAFFCIADILFDWNVIEKVETRLGGVKTVLIGFCICVLGSVLNGGL